MKSVSYEDFWVHRVKRVSFFISKIAFCLKNRYKENMKRSFIRMSELWVGDEFRFTSSSATIYLSNHLGAPVDGIDFVLLQVMCNIQYTFYADSGLIVRHGFPALYDYEVILLKRGGS